MILRYLTNNCVLQLRSDSDHATLHTHVFDMSELYQLRAKHIPPGGDWRWLPNQVLVSSSGTILSKEM